MPPDKLNPISKLASDPGRVAQQRLASMTLHSDASLLEAFAAIDSGAAGICLVENSDGAFAGVLTDGDIRRALLAGSSLSDSLRAHIVDSPFVVGPDALRDNVLDVMQSRRLDAVPVVDEHGQLVGLHVLHELIRPTSVENLAVIMAGGKGTRLGDITKNVPKPMLEVAGRPILERIVQKLVGQGIRNIAISVNHLADVIIDHFGSGEEHGCKITYLRETVEHPLGTGGSLSLLSSAGLDVTLPLFVMNGDVIADAPFLDVLESHLLNENSVTMCCSRYEHTVPFGVVETTEELVELIVEKPTSQWQVNAGIYVVSPNTLDLVEPNMEFPITDLVCKAIERGDRVAAFELPGPWLDIGRPSELRQARGEEPK